MGVMLLTVTLTLTLATPIPLGVMLTCSKNNTAGNSFYINKVRVKVEVRVRVRVRIRVRVTPLPCTLLTVSTRGTRAMHAVQANHA